MRDTTPQNSENDITKPATQMGTPSTTVNQNARNPDGQNHTMKGCAVGEFHPTAMDIDRPMAISPFSEIGAKKYEH